MASYISLEGVWFPAKEKVALTDPKTGEPRIYEGPDRAAQEELKAQGLKNFGQDFRRDPDFLKMIKDRGFDTIESFLKYLEYDENKAKVEFEKHMGKPNIHEPLPRKRAQQVVGGGADTSGGGNSKFGGFGEIPK